jgi:uncharacterized membrane protein YagU involved in acid resistance
LVAPIIAGGLLAGVLDLAAAFALAVSRGGTPQRVLQAIASGFLGRDAFTGGMAATVLGLASHFTIALGAAAVYVLASRRLRWMSAHWLIVGPLYGMAVWTAMQFVVLPLSAFPGGGAHTLEGVLTGLTVHVFCVGLPIAWAARRW